ncbi:hypothetical protein [Blastococcus sp. URHD0036]|uniref:hypothetical protein n=1 Tax=Blastococcus sp. URHD0036 TaxID=1380356 RepID=UPI00049642EC|nr:hypothetical protein [Blastococcus sp. URHD0036]
MTIVWAASDQLPEDVGKSGPFGLLLLVLGLIAVGFLVRSMTRHLKRVPVSFDPVEEEPGVDVPDTPEELLQERREPGADVLDTLRRAPRAIEPPREDGRGSGSAG